jgi:hypothetical protein
MKAHITLRSTIGNTSWLQRGAAALLVAVVVFTLAAALRPNVYMPAVQHAAPAARHSNVPISGTGSAYDGGAYGIVRPVTVSEKVPVIGAGSAYNGGN